MNDVKGSACPSSYVPYLIERLWMHGSSMDRSQLRHEHDDLDMWMAGARIPITAQNAMMVRIVSAVRHAPGRRYGIIAGQRAARTGTPVVSQMFARRLFADALATGSHGKLVSRLTMLAGSIGLDLYDIGQWVDYAAGVPQHPDAIMRRLGEFYEAARK